jgi:hypothetical protein
MDKNYLLHIAGTKADFHKSRAKMPYEDKVKIIVELQKIENEFIKDNKNRSTTVKYRKVWEI